MFILVKKTVPQQDIVFKHFVVPNDDSSQNNPKNQLCENSEIEFSISCFVISFLINHYLNEIEFHSIHISLSAIIITEKTIHVLSVLFQRQ